MKKAWGSHQVCVQCKVTRTKNTYCSKCDPRYKKANVEQRASWDEYFMDIAVQVSSRATCLRKKVGAVLVLDRTILSTGYNGSVKGMQHCTDAGCMMEEGHCVRTVHAEANAIIQAAKNGTRIDGATIYTTASPCWWCFKLIVNSGIKKIVFGEVYRDDRIGEFSKEADIHLQWLRRDDGLKEKESRQGRTHSSTAKGLPRARKGAVRERR